MNTRRALVALAGGIAATALAAGAVPVGAQEPLLPISVTPGSGPAGTVATVSGAGCLGSAGAGDIEVYLFDGTADAPVDAFVGTVAADGSWSFGLQFEATDTLGTYDFDRDLLRQPGGGRPRRRRLRLRVLRADRGRAGPGPRGSRGGARRPRAGRARLHRLSHGHPDRHGPPSRGRAVTRPGRGPVRAGLPPVPVRVE